MVLCLALQRKTNLAQSMLPSAKACDSSLWIPVIKRIDQSLNGASSQVVEKASQLTLQIIEEVDDFSKMSKRQAQAVKRQRAQSLARVGQLAESISAFQTLVKQDIRDLDLRIAYATVLQSSGKKEHKQAALEQWRTISQGIPKGSDTWFQAKYAVARCLFELDQKKKAADVIRLTSTLHPQLGGPALKSKFVTLLGKCTE